MQKENSKCVRVSLLPTPCLQFGYPMQASSSMPPAWMPFSTYGPPMGFNPQSTLPSNPFGPLATVRFSSFPTSTFFPARVSECTHLSLQSTFPPQPRGAPAQTATLPTAAPTVAPSFCAARASLVLTTQNILLRRKRSLYPSGLRRRPGPGRTDGPGLPQVKPPRRLPLLSSACRQPLKPHIHATTTTTPASAAPTAPTELEDSTAPATVPEAGAA